MPGKKTNKIKLKTAGERPSDASATSDQLTTEASEPFGRMSEILSNEMIEDGKF